MNPERIIPGQFYRYVPEEKGPVQGWTIVPGQSDPAVVWVIRNDIRTAKPVPMKPSDIKRWIANGEWVETSAPVKPKVEIEDLDEERQKEILQVEENRYQVIKPLIDLEADVFWPHVRRKAMKEIAKSKGITVDNVWQWLCAYWQFAGRIGLRPRAPLAGQKGLQERVELAQRAAKQSELEFDQFGKGVAKSANELFPSYKTGRKQHPDNDQGMVMKLTDVMTCRRCAWKHLFVKSPDNLLHYDYDTAYTALLADYYGYAKGKQGNPPVPSKDQFITAVETDPDFLHLSIRIVGKFAAIRDHRQKTGTTQFEALGPGHILQIDDVDTKVLLVHPNTRMPLGTGKVFVGIDQWSKVLAGGHLTLDGSSYEGVKELLVTVALPKDHAFFEQRGLDVDPIHFPAHGIFRSVMPDKGPLGASLGNILPKGFSDLSNPASYRPDLKSDIESSFHAYLRQHAEKLPGYNRVDRGGGNVDPKFIACLTPAEFMKLWWDWAEVYNQRPLDCYLPEEALKVDPKLRPGNTPFELWPWGLEEVSGYIMHKPEDEVRRNLLRQKHATLTKRDGIKFLKLHYLIDEDMPVRFVSTPVTLFFSESYLLKIYVWLEGRLVTATMRQDDAVKFGHLTYFEILAEKKLNEDQAVRVRTNHRKAKVKGYRKRQAIGGSASKNRKELYPHELVRKLLVNGLPQSVAREDALKIEKSAAREAESRVFSNGEKAPPTPPPPAMTTIKKKSSRELRG